MLRSVKAHRRTLLTRSLLCLPVLGLLGLQLVTSLRGADRRIGVTIHTGVTPVKITDVEPGSPAATAVAAEEHEPGMRTGDSFSSMPSRSRSASITTAGRGISNVAGRRFSLSSERGSGCFSGSCRVCPSSGNRSF